MTSRLSLILAAGLTIAIGLAIAAFLQRSEQGAAGIGIAGTGIGGPFSLVDGGGKAVTDADFRGEWLLLYFGYTHCPDVCPTTLTSIGSALDKMPQQDRRKLRVLFITVDPERDTPKVVGAYAQAFGPEFVGLTGKPGQIAEVEREFRVYAAKHPLSGGDYAMDHSSVIYVMDPKGKFTGVLDDDMAPPDMAKRLEKLGA